MNKIETHLYYLEEYYNKGNELVKWNDLNDFERSYKLNFKLEQIKARLSYLHKWRLAIGQEVYLSRKSWDYTLVAGYHLLDIHNKNNFDNSSSTVFTEEMFDKLCADYIDYSIEFLLRDLLERILVSNSTHKLGNLAFEWVLECKQELIKEFKLCKQ